MAKRIIKLIHSVGEVVNADPDVAGRLKVVFPANFNVSMAEKIYPGADISEQISMAGKEASGTGNMKFSLNGALTVGTLDGANIEIRLCVGEENFFQFGLDANEVIALKERGYNPMEYYQGNAELKAIIDSLVSGQFSRGDTELFRPIVDSLLLRDDYLLLADFQSYIDCCERAAKAYRDKEKLDADVDPEHGPVRVLFVGPDDSAVLRRDLGREAGAGGVGDCEACLRPPMVDSQFRIVQRTSQ